MRGGIKSPYSVALRGKCRLLIYLGFFFFFLSLWRLRGQPKGLLLSRDSAQGGGSADLCPQAVPGWVCRCWAPWRAGRSLRSGWAGAACGLKAMGTAAPAAAAEIRPELLDLLPNRAPWEARAMASTQCSPPSPLRGVSFHFVRDLGRSGGAWRPAGLRGTRGAAAGLGTANGGQRCSRVAGGCRTSGSRGNAPRSSRTAALAFCPPGASVVA
jgi:hypothetical protein